MVARSGYPNGFHGGCRPWPKKKAPQEGGSVRLQMIIKGCFSQTKQRHQKYRKIKQSCARMDKNPVSKVSGFRGLFKIITQRFTTEMKLLESIAGRWFYATHVVWQVEDGYD